MKKVYIVYYGTSLTLAYNPNQYFSTIFDNRSKAVDYMKSLMTSGHKLVTLFESQESYRVKADYVVEEHL